MQNFRRDLLRALSAMKEKKQLRFQAIQVGQSERENVTSRGCFKNNSRRELRRDLSRRIDCDAISTQST